MADNSTPSKAAVARRDLHCVDQCFSDEGRPAAIRGDLTVLDLRNAASVIPGDRKTDPRAGITGVVAIARQR